MSVKGSTKFHPDTVIRAIVASDGFVSVAADALGCCRATILNYRKKYKAVEQAFQDTNEKLKDFAEGKLLQMIRDGQVAATIFYLKTKCRDRGYVERAEVEQSGEITYRVKVPDLPPEPDLGDGHEPLKG